MRRHQKHVVECKPFGNLLSYHGFLEFTPWIINHVTTSCQYRSRFLHKTLTQKEKRPQFTAGICRNLDLKTKPFNMPRRFAHTAESRSVPNRGNPRQSIRAHPPLRFGFSRPPELTAPSSGSNFRFET